MAFTRRDCAPERIDARGFRWCSTAQIRSPPPVLSITHPPHRDASTLRLYPFGKCHPQLPCIRWCGGLFDRFSSILGSARPAGRLPGWDRPPTVSLPHTTTSVEAAYGPSAALRASMVLGAVILLQTGGRHIPASLVSLLSRSKE